MTDSDSLRGDPSHDPTRVHHPELRELDTLRALLRPRMTATGDASFPEALRGLIVELDGVTGQANLLHERVKVLEADLEADLAAERKLAVAAAEGHDHCRELLVAACSTLGSEDYDNLPHLVASLLEQLNTSNGKAERLQDRVDEQDKARVLRAAETASERNHLEGELTRAKAEIKSLTHATFTIHQLTTAIGNAAKEVGVLCEGRSAVDILPDLLANMKRRVERATRMDAQRAEWAHGFSAQAQAEAQADSVAFVREYEIKAARWGRVCEAFGFDPEQDPPASIPAILAGDRWTNTRRMLADACANLRAPSLEVILGELVQTLSKARGVAMDLVNARNMDELMCTGCARRIAHGECKHPVQGCGDCYWLEFRDAPPQVRVDAEAVAPAPPPEFRLPSSARCPVCHRMAPVKEGRFQYHLSGDRPCAGTAPTGRNGDAYDLQLKALLHLGWTPGSDPLAWATARLGRDETRRAALVHLGWDGEGDPEAWAKDMAAERSKLMATLITGHDEARKFRFDVEEELRNVGVVDYERDIVSRIGAAFKRSITEGEAVTLLKRVRETLGVPNDGSGSTLRAVEVIREELAAHGRTIEALELECTNLRTALEDRNARIHQLEIDNSKVHLEGRIKLAEKRVEHFRAWLLGMCPQPPRDKSGTIIAPLTDDALIASLQFVPRADYDKAMSALVAIQSVFAAIQDLPG